MNWTDGAALYRPRKPTESPLWRLLHDHFPRFVLEYEKRFQRQYGFFRLVISDVVQKFLECGNLQQGFARIRCPECHHEYLLAFSCRGRWFCPSCHAKIVVQFAERLKEEILYPVPHRQYVFSIPIILRRFFKYDRKLLGKLCHCVNQSLTDFFRTGLNLADGVPGMVMVIHTFGDYARWHPHVHVMIADGLFRKNGVFYVMPRIDLKPLQEIFRARVLAMMRKEGRIDDIFIHKIMKWRHTSGFSAHNGMQVSRGDQVGQEAVAQYIIRNTFSLDKVTYKPETGMVVYKSKMTHGRNKKNFKVFSAGEFIASITQHIPDKSFQLARYYGWYSNRSRGERRKDTGQQNDSHDTTLPPEGIEVVDVSTYKPRRIPPKTWRECIKKIWEVDPLKCPRCHAVMKIISFITEKAVVRRILKHLDLWRQESADSNKDPPETCNDLPVRETVYGEPFGDGWPEPGDELFLDDVYPD